LTQSIQKNQIYNNASDLHRITYIEIRYLENAKQI